MSKLHQRPAAMVGPTILGLLGLAQAVIHVSDASRVIGLVLFVGAIGFWIMAFTVDPGPDARPPDRLRLTAVVVGAMAVAFTAFAVLAVAR